ISFCSVRRDNKNLFHQSSFAIHLQLVFRSYHRICLRPYHFLKLVSFLGANRNKSASVCLCLLRALYKYLNTIQYNTIQYLRNFVRQCRGLLVGGYWSGVIGRGLLVGCYWPVTRPITT